MSALAATSWLLVAGLLAAATVLVLRGSAERREAEQGRRDLLEMAVRQPGRFDPASTADLPEPARRFFNFAIEPGTRLSTVVEIRMEGQLSLGTRERPGYLPMQGEQVLAAPFGLVWQVQVGRGVMRFSGSDGMVAGRSWTRFRLLRLFPLVRAGGDRDHLRSSFGRVVAEAALWTPAFLLPGPGVAWTALDQDTARATITHLDMVQDVDLKVDPAGRPLWVRIPRWSNANPDREFRLQPFGGEPSDFRKVAGYRLPFRLEGGNFFGTPEYFPFYRARVISIDVR